MVRVDPTPNCQNAGLAVFNEGRSAFPPVLVPGLGQRYNSD